MSSTAVLFCAKPGCSLPAFIEPRTNIAHKYCGRTHAMEAMGRNAVQKPHGLCHQCNLNGCRNTVAFDSTTGRVHDFCCKQHARVAIQSGAWMKPVREAYRHYHGGASSTGHICRFPNCTLPVFVNAATGRRFDYCGRSHAVEHRLLLSRSSHRPNTSVGSFAGSGSVVTSVARGGSAKPVSSSSSSSSSVGMDHSTIVAGNVAERQQKATTSVSFAHAPPTRPHGPFIFGRSDSSINVPSSAAAADTASSWLDRKLPASTHSASTDSAAAASTVKPIKAQQTTWNNMTQKIHPGMRTQKLSAATGVATAPIAVSSKTATTPVGTTPGPVAVPSTTNDTTSTSTTANSTTMTITHPQCTVCLSRNANIILLPCGHVCLCQEDVEKLKANRQLLTCPICRQSIASTHKVFLNHS